MNASSTRSSSHPLRAARADSGRRPRRPLLERAVHARQIPPMLLRALLTARVTDFGLRGQSQPLTDDHQGLRPSRGPIRTRWSLRHAPSALCRSERVRPSAWGDRRHRSNPWCVLNARTRWWCRSVRTRAQRPIGPRGPIRGPIRWFLTRCWSSTAAWSRAASGMRRCRRRMRSVPVSADSASPSRGNATTAARSRAGQVGGDDARLGQARAREHGVVESTI